MTQTDKKTVTIGIVPVGADPYMTEIPVDDESKGLDALNGIVGGPIESFDVLSPDADVTIYVNEQGVPMALPPNRAVYATKRMAMLGYASQAIYGMPMKENDLYAILFGDFTIVAHDRQGDMRDLTDTEFHEIADRFFGETSQRSGTREIDRMAHEMLARDHPDGIIIIAPDEDAAATMHADAEANGLTVKSTKVWTGPIPPDSYQSISSTARMSTAEFYLFRKTNVADPILARLAAMEMLGKYQTQITCESMPRQSYVFLTQERTSKPKMERYLRPIADTPQAKRTEEVIKDTPTSVATPLQAWLTIALCMPRQLGGYGIGQPLCAAAFQNEGLDQTTNERKDEFCPAAYGQYLAYDLIWPDRMIALQYTGPSQPNAHDLRALTVDDTVDVMCLTDEMLDERHVVATLDAIAEKVLGQVPTDVHEKMRQRVLEFLPRNDCMLMTHTNLIDHI